MSAQPKSDSKPCFIISPISDETTRERTWEMRKADYFLSEVFEPACLQAGLEAMRIDRDKRTQFITEAMIEALATAPIAVALLDNQLPRSKRSSGSSLPRVFNPNVMYEIGLRHAWCLPVVIVSSLEPSMLPFDLRDCPIVRYPPLSSDWNGNPGTAPWNTSTELGALVTRLADKIKAVVQDASESADKRFRSGLHHRSIRDQLALILKGKRRSLDNLKRSLARLPVKINNDYELKKGNADALNDLAELVAGYGRDFDTELTTLRLVAEEQLAEASGINQLLDLCQTLATIAEDLSEIEDYMRASAQLDQDAKTSVKELKSRVDRLNGIAKIAVIETINLIKII